ncbi:hypothetical protein K402DRAFT_41787 [Aulographum hederae CBS 113979]|uniref:Uncharacterized protein n=1 Tax=Aulographum hederae CBS 113979 TaxID=1176131 RepID=A0A6G1H3P8_9PEZI|nr:hypothetical protein K402DRAFT_41787 [Aulographum hederae CBS 113979]
MRILRMNVQLMAEVVWDQEKDILIVPKLHSLNRLWQLQETGNQFQTARMRQRRRLESRLWIESDQFDDSAPCGRRWGGNWGSVAEDGGCGGGCRWSLWVELVSGGSRWRLCNITW